MDSNSFFANAGLRLLVVGAKAFVARFDQLLAFPSQERTVNFEWMVAFCPDIHQADDDNQEIDQ
jgi:hypothetical protein